MIKTMLSLQCHGHTQTFNSFVFWTVFMGSVEIFIFLSMMHLSCYVYGINFLVFFKKEPVIEIHPIVFLNLSSNHNLRVHGLKAKIKYVYE